MASALVANDDWLDCYLNVEENKSLMSTMRSLLAMQHCSGLKLKTIKIIVQNRQNKHKKQLLLKFHCCEKLIHTMTRDLYSLVLLTRYQPTLRNNENIFNKTIFYTINNTSVMRATNLGPRRNKATEGTLISSKNSKSLC